MEFEALRALPGDFAHRFILRQPGMDVLGERDEVIERLRAWHLRHARELGFGAGALATARQVHGDQVAIVRADTPPGHEFAEADGLVSNVPGRLLGIYVADCCAVFLADAEAGSFGLVHSGRRGSEAGIVARAIELMAREHGAEPRRMRVQLSPCIRPPAYEVDFAAQIRADAAAAGVPVEQIHDEGVCTSSDTERFYSYRLEKGRTGRMLALFGRRELASTLIRC